MNTCWEIFIFVEAVYIILMIKSIIYVILLYFNVVSNIQEILIYIFIKIVIKQLKLNKSEKKFWIIIFLNSIKMDIN